MKPALAARWHPSTMRNHLNRNAATPTYALFGRHKYDNLTVTLKEVDSAMQCQICKKAGMSGNNVSHSNRHTKTRFKANVHKQTISLNGKVQRVKICSRCLRTLHKPPRVKGKSAIS